MLTDELVPPTVLRQIELPRLLLVEISYEANSDA